MNNVGEDMKNYTVMNLSMISRLAVLENAKRTEKAIDCLVSVLRYESGRIETLSTVEIELKIIEKMFQLHEMKKGPGFRGIIHNELKQDKCYIKKGQLVSLIEVALSKKISKDRDCLEIILSICKQKETTLITIKDDGETGENEHGESITEQYDLILKEFHKLDDELEITQKPGIGTKAELKVLS